MLFVEAGKLILIKNKNFNKSNNSNFKLIKKQNKLNQYFIIKSKKNDENLSNELNLITTKKNKEKFNLENQTIVEEKSFYGKNVALLNFFFEVKNEVEMIEWPSFAKLFKQFVIVVISLVFSAIFIYSIDGFFAYFSKIFFEGKI
jgi:preprotein translocase SecE subunit